MARRDVRDIGRRNERPEWRSEGSQNLEERRVGKGAVRAVPACGTNRPLPRNVLVGTPSDARSRDPSALPTLVLTYLPLQGIDLHKNVPWTVTVVPYLQGINDLAPACRETMPGCGHSLRAAVRVKRYFGS
jgi:hypothetical protein